MPARNKTQQSRRDTNLVVGFRLAPAIAREVKAEAARRGLKLNQLFAEMWTLYKRKRPEAGS